MYALDGCGCGGCGGEPDMLVDLSMGVQLFICFSCLKPYILAEVH